MRDEGGQGGMVGTSRDKGRQGSGEGGRMAAGREERGVHAAVHKHTAGQRAEICLRWSCGSQQREEEEPVLGAYLPDTSTAPLALWCASLRACLDGPSAPSAVYQASAPCRSTTWVHACAAPSLMSYVRIALPRLLLLLPPSACQGSCVPPVAAQAPECGLHAFWLDHHQAN